MNRAGKRCRELMFRPYVTPKTIEGVDFQFYVGSLVGRNWYDAEHCGNQWPEMRLVRDLLVSPGDRVIEAGAHHGCTTMLLANWVGEGGAVLALEPALENIVICRRNIALNKLTNVEAVQAAVGDNNCQSAFQHMCIRPGSDNRAAETVSVRRLDDWIDWAPTLLKLDVQGYEVKALRGAEQILATRPKLLIEVHCNCIPGYGDRVEDLFDLIDWNAYAATALYPGADRPVPFTPDATAWKAHKQFHLFATPNAQG